MKYNLNNAICVEVDCRFCGAKAGHKCRTTTLAIVPKPHQHRLNDYLKLMGK